MDNFKHDFSLHEDNQLANSQVLLQFLLWAYLKFSLQIYPILITLIA